jgi:hypothetical protein
MNAYSKIVAGMAALALSAAAAFAAGPPNQNPHRLAAPGQYCKAESKKHVAGQSGTPFSLCVKAQAKLRSGSTSSPQAACKAESKKRVAGRHGTPFSLCVSAGAKLLKDQKAQNQ